MAWSPRLRSHTVFTYGTVKQCLTGREFGADHPFRATRRALGKSVLDIDGEPHHRIRAVLSEPLKRAEVEDEHLAVVRPIVRQVVGDALRSPSDLGSNIADTVPMRVLTTLLGIPPGDVNAVYRLTRSLAAYINQEPVALTRIKADLRDLTDYLRRELFAPGVPARGGALGRAIVAAVADGRLSPREGIDNTMLLLVSGTETTSCAIASTLGQVLSRPDLQSALRAGALDPQAAIGEFLRLQPPVRFTPRFVVEPVEVGSVELQPGQIVNVCIASGNRDGNCYLRPDDFDANRAERPDEPTPVTFGRGAHSCFGAFLGRLEIAEVLGELARHPAIRAVDDPRRLRPGWTFRRPDRLNFEWATS